METREAIWTAVYVALIAGGAWALWSYWDFFKASWIEVRHKCTWPGWKEVQGTTIVVLIATVVFALYLFICDLFFQWAMMSLLDFVGGA